MRRLRRVLCISHQPGKMTDRFAAAIRQKFKEVRDSRSLLAVTLNALGTVGTAEWERVPVSARGASGDPDYVGKVSLIAPTHTRLDSEGLQEFQALTLSCPNGDSSPRYRQTNFLKHFGSNLKRTEARTLSATQNRRP